MPLGVWIDGLDHLLSADGRPEELHGAVGLQDSIGRDRLQPARLAEDDGRARGAVNAEAAKINMDRRRRSHGERAEIRTADVAVRIGSLYLQLTGLPRKRLRNL